MHRLANMPESSFHRDILRDNNADALQSPAISIWAAGVLKQYASLGLASPISIDIQSIDAHDFQQAQLAREKSVWDGLHISPGNAPSARAKLRTYLRWFVRPNCLSLDPQYTYYKLPFFNLFFYLLTTSMPADAQGRYHADIVPGKSMMMLPAG